MREIHHFCVLFGFGADAVYPYGVYRLLRVMGEGVGKVGGGLGGVGFGEAVENYRNAAEKVFYFISLINFHNQKKKPFLIFHLCRVSAKSWPKWVSPPFRDIVAHKSLKLLAFPKR